MEETPPQPVVAEPPSPPPPAQQPRQRHARALRGALWPPLVAMTILTALLLWQVSALLSAFRWVEHTDAVIAQAQTAQKLLIDMQTGRRGYTLSGGDRIYLAPYLNAEKNIVPAFHRLADLVADSRDQERLAQDLLRGYEAWIAPVRQHGDDWVPEGKAALSASMREGADRFNALRDGFDRFIAAEERLRGERSDTVQRQASQTLGVGALAALLIGGLLAFSTRRRIGVVAAEYETLLDAEQQARERLGATLASIGDGVLVTDARGFVTAMNPVAETLTGWKGAEATGKSARVVFDIVNETTRAEVESPVARVLREGVVVGLANHTILRRRDESEIAIDDSGAPVRNADGSMTGVVLVFRDISERRAGEQRREFLADLSERTRALADPEAVLEEAARALGAFLGASRCAYSEVDAAADTITTRRDHTDGVASRLGTSRLDAFGTPVVDQLRAGLPVAIEDVRTDPRVGDEHRENYHPDELPSLLAVPLLKEGKLAAVLAVHQNAPRAWTEEEIRLLGVVAERTWLAVENARLYREAREQAQRQARLAETLQRSLLLTPEAGAFPGVEVDAVYESSPLDDALVGGDFFDAFALEGGKVALLVGDVTGKGLAAATFTAEVKFALRAFLREHGGDPAAALARLNRHISDGQRLDGKAEGVFLCVTVAVVDTVTGEATFAAAGGEPPLVLRTAGPGAVEEVPVRGMILGTSPDWREEPTILHLDRGDMLLLYTDGLTEARRGRGRAFFGVDGVAAAAREASALPLSELTAVGEAVVSAARSFADGALIDDVCLLLTRLRPT